MPIIEFYCKKCDYTFEELIFKSSEMKSIKCPKCKGNSLKRLYSTFGFTSKGSSKSQGNSACTSCSRSSCAGCSK
ncbi:MAG: zinc ribbon domain-containing protein [candidate division WOR-3 bacterium]|nr:MAG: zinc ribbon domain-containing protein [candidate division WOR-3 bacterium]